MDAYKIKKSVSGDLTMIQPLIPSCLFGIGKRTVFKVLKDSPENFRDLSTLADCDTDKSIDAASKLVWRP
jgi:hypothetical protein